MVYSFIFPHAIFFSFLLYYQGLLFWLHQFVTLTHFFLTILSSSTMTHTPLFSYKYHHTSCTFSNLILLKYTWIKSSCSSFPSSSSQVFYATVRALWRSFLNPSLVYLEPSPNLNSSPSFITCFQLRCNTWTLIALNAVWLPLCLQKGQHHQEN